MKRNRGHAVSTIRDRILAYLQFHPEGADDSELTASLGLKHHAQANDRCRKLASEGLIERRRVGSTLRNFWPPSGAPQTPPASPEPFGTELTPLAGQPWFWEGNVQARVVTYLKSKGCIIPRQADTAAREQGRDIEADCGLQRLWVTVKGFPRGTQRTQPSTQAGHWFKEALFDLVAWRGEDVTVQLAAAFPDFPRYHRLAARVAWLQPVARLDWLWVREDGSVETCSNLRSAA